ncbi:MAG: hypothetical protein LUQ32_01320 [Methanomicrobiales archaeon]|nr:hypothetical protein [Methanomicrobiales archaeon]
MRWPLRVLLVLLLIGLALPVLAIDGNKIGYISFEQVRIQLHNGNARVEVDYTLDPGMNLIILLFGVGDLEKKVERSLNFPSLKAEEVGPSHAIFTVEGASENYGDRTYWFPAHSFGITFPQVKVKAPGYSVSYTRARAIPKGFGYFGDMP